MLVVEDEPILCRQIETAISGAGYVVDCAADGERAEDAAVLSTGGCVHVLGLHVRLSLLASDGRGLLGSAARAEKGPEAVPRSERGDGSPHVSWGNRGQSSEIANSLSTFRWKTATLLLFGIKARIQPVTIVNALSQ